MLKINKLTAGYDGKTVVSEVSFTAATGKVTVLFGPNGCGKSTLLKALCGLVPVTSGELFLEEENLRTMDAKTLAQRITYLAQSRQIPDITVNRLVLHGRFPYLSYPRKYRPEDYAAAKAAMEQVGISDLAELPVSKLSGGQRQKVYLAMALAQDTPVILMDEPTTFLDIKHQLQTMGQARALADSGKTVLLVVHDVNQAMNVADELVLMEQGRMVTHGTPEAVYQSQTIEKVFSVSLHRVETEQGWRYFCEEKGE